MKKILILAAATAVLCSCGSKNKYTIEGQAPEGTFYLYANREVVDSATVKDGKFRFEGIVPEEPVRNLANANKPENITSMAVVILEPGTILISENQENPGRLIVTGTPANDAKTAYDAANKVLTEEYRSKDTTDERRKAIEEEYDRQERTFLEQNRNNYFGIILLHQLAYNLSGQEILDEIAKFPVELQQSDILVKLGETAGQKIKTDIGQPYIDIVQPNAAGEQVALKSVVENPANKYTLIDFWASWCGPCMGEVPHLKKTYDEFHKKGFEIYGVSFDSNRDKWLAAVEQNGMNWLHVSEVNGFDNQAAKDYAVQGIPSNFLIDSQGTIVASNLRGEQLYEKIAELIAQ